MTDTETDRMSITRRIAAPVERIFALVSSPQGHVDIDGSGMLVATDDADTPRAVGDTFEMHMDREPLGDLPLGRYTVCNTVTVFEQDREFAWTVGAVGRTPIGHVYGYRLEPVDEATTDVTSYYDWSAISDKWRERVSWPVVPKEMLEASLDNLERLATGPARET